MKFISFVKSKALRGVGAVSVALALGAGLVGCGGEAASGDVAATVNGTNIMEQEITDYIADFRTNSQLEENDAWGEWMVSSGYTPETVREEVIDYFVENVLYDQAASEFGVTVEQADIDAQLEQTKAMFGDDETFQKALESSNMTEESYIEDVVKPGVLRTKLSEAVIASKSEGSEDDKLLARAQEMADEWNGAKRVSHILFKTGEEKTDDEVAVEAQDVLDQINAGSLSFEDAAKEHSEDSSAENGGDVGWDKLSSFVEDFQTAVDGLEKDQVSELVKSEYGYHIIKVTDMFTVPEGGITSLDQLPDEFVEYLRYMQQSDDSQVFSTWFQEYREGASIEIKDMPEGLPYDIDIAPYEEAAAAEGASEDGAASAGDDAAAGTDGASEGDAADAGEGDAADEAAAGDGSDQTVADQGAGSDDSSAEGDAGDAAAESE